MIRNSNERGRTEKASCYSVHINLRTLLSIAHQIPTVSEKVTNEEIVLSLGRTITPEDLVHSERTTSQAFSPPEIQTVPKKKMKKKEKPTRWENSPHSEIGPTDHRRKPTFVLRQSDECSSFRSPHRVPSLACLAFWLPSFCFLLPSISLEREPCVSILSKLINNPVE